MQSKSNEFSEAKAVDSRQIESVTNGIPSPRIGYSERADAQDRIRMYLAHGYLTSDEYAERYQAASEAVTAEDLSKLFIGLPRITAQSADTEAATAQLDLANQTKAVRIIGWVKDLVWPVSVLIWGFWDLGFNLGNSWLVFVLAGIISVAAQLLLWASERDGQSELSASSKRRGELEEGVRAETQRGQDQKPINPYGV